MKLGRLLIGFVQQYDQCAKLCYRDGLNRYPLMPKLHFVHHSGLRLVVESQTADWVVSPLSTSCAMQEDFIGKPARLSRRVSASMLLHVRLLVERLLICSMYAAERADHDARGLYAQ